MGEEVSIPKLKLGDEICVRFHDHVEDGHEAILIRAYGQVVRLTKRDLVIASWTIEDEDPQVVHNNWKIFTILRSTIIGVRKFR